MKGSAEVRNQARDLLMELIRFPSTRGNEGPAIRYLCERLRPVVDSCQLVEIHDTIMEDPDYAFPLPGHTYKDTPNLECVIRGTGGGRSIIFNTHLDVVPASEGQSEPFSPREKDGIIFGRGACDAKGQVAALFGAMMLLAERSSRPKGDLIFHFVVEEESGGNGTLAMVRRGVRADGVVVLEPSDFTVLPTVRGAVWFELQVFGRAGHSGSKGTSVSALDKAYQAMEILRGYHDRLLAESRGLPLFDPIEDPMPITFGQLSAGNWPSMVPAKAVVKGILGFLPNRNRFQVQQGMREAILSQGDEWLREHFDLSFPMLNSDGNAIPVGHPLVTSLLDAVRGNGVEAKLSGMTGSCDAWFYNNQAQIPTVVFGPGSLSYGHSKDEQIVLDDVLTASSILVDFLDYWG
jgi:acetylornithine deacetylase